MAGRCGTGHHAAYGGSERRHVDQQLYGGCRQFGADLSRLRRYDFVTATLREVRGGPPPIVVVEGTDRQIRSHRVAVVSAIYRNDAPVLLLQLRPGDQLKMLRPTDAGEIMYIEATAR